MAISLKDQIRILNEGIHYRAPFTFGPKGFSVLKKGMEDIPTRKVATQMFYDFYAMELMHRLFGSPIPDPDIENPEYQGELTPQQKAKFKRAVQRGGEDATGAMYVPNWNDVEEPTMGGTIVPASLRKVIDQVYDEVVIQITDKLMAHLRLSLIQEFRYLITHSDEWQRFRHRLVGIYNKNNGTISSEEFRNAIQEKIPRLVGHEDAVKRLLKFCKYFASMNPDPADSIPKNPKSKKSDEPVQHIPEPNQDSESEPTLEPKTPEEPDDTDYTMPPVEIPSGADWEDEPYKYSDEVEKTKLAHWLQTHKKLSEGVDDPGYASGRISPSTVMNVRQAINKSGLTWHDILLAYTNLEWGNAYGGPKWGAGVEAYIKLLDQAKNKSIEEMAGVVDHIYDLEHNSGALLNKGGMYVAPADLDRRAKVTHITRYLKNVSPLIQRLILRVLPYISSHPEIDKNPDAIINSPTAPMPIEAQEKLTASKFVKSSSGNDWTTQSPFKNKKGSVVQDQYTAKYHTNGMYSVRDSLDTDVQVFEKLEDFEKWMKQNAPNFTPSVPGSSYYNLPKYKSEKEILLETPRIKLDAEKETILLEECKMAWRPLKRCYVAYLSYPLPDEIELFAFTDGTFSVCIKSTNKIAATFNDWDLTLSYCKTQTANAIPNPYYEEGKAWIGKPMGSSEFVHQKYSLQFLEVEKLQKFIATKDGTIAVFPNLSSENGLTIFTTANTPHGEYLFAIGRTGTNSYDLQYDIYHTVGNHPKEAWHFTTFDSAYNFISNQFEALIQTKVPLIHFNKVSPSSPNFSLTASEIKALDDLIKMKTSNVIMNSDPHLQLKNDDKMILFMMPIGSGFRHLFSVGRSNNYYIVEHVMATAPWEKWTFPTFVSAYDFVGINLKGLIQINVPIKTTPSASAVPLSFANQSQEVPLPPPSPSKATYEAHLGIAKPPTHTIRLTHEDENLLSNIGFHPRMQGGDVWYIHDKLHDVVKFFPNNIAKIILPQGNIKATVTKTIEDAIAWLISKYSGATTSPTVASSTPSIQGSKAGSLYEKILTAAGFVWDSMGFDYVNISTNDTIKIYPYPKSTFINGATGDKKVFNTLPALAIFVKGLNPV